MIDYPLRTLHAGLGAVGMSLLQAIAGSPLFEVVGLVDLEPEAREAAVALAGLTAEDGFAELAEAIAACDPDAVVVAVPAAIRSDLIVQALAGDLHVLAAAPLAASEEEIRQCTVISLNRGARLMMVPETVPASTWTAQFHAYVTEGVEPPTSARRVLAGLEGTCPADEETRS